MVVGLPGYIYIYIPKDHWTLETWRHFEDLNTPAIRTREVRSPLPLEGPLDPLGSMINFAFWLLEVQSDQSGANHHVSLRIQTPPDRIGF